MRDIQGSASQTAREAREFGANAAEAIKQTAESTLAIGMAVMKPAVTQFSCL